MVRTVDDDNEPKTGSAEEIRIPQADDNEPTTTTSDGIEIPQAERPESSASSQTKEPRNRRADGPGIYRPKDSKRPSQPSGVAHPPSGTADQPKPPPDPGQSHAPRKVASSEHVPSIQVDALDIGDELGKGGQASVAQVMDGSDTLIKRYVSGVRCDDSALARIVNWRDTLTDEDLSVIIQRSSWPHHVVRENSATVGVLIKRAPASFYLPDSRLAEMLYLYYPERIKKMGVAVPETDAGTRVKILLSLAEVMDTMHRNDMVHGDISMRNVLWSDRPPYCFVLDCDGVAYANFGGALPAVNTLHWTDPRVDRGTIPGPDIDSDRYAFALAVFRIHFRMKGGAQSLPRFLSGIPATPYLTDDLKQLLVDGLSETAPRPPMSRWIHALRAYDASASGRSDNEMPVDLVTGFAAPTGPSVPTFGSREVAEPPTQKQPAPPKPAKPAKPAKKPTSFVSATKPAKPPAPITKPKTVSRATVVITVLCLLLAFIIAAIVTVIILQNSG